jgi:hypothetical protein
MEMKNAKHGNKQYEISTHSYNFSFVYLSVKLRINWDSQHCAACLPGRKHKYTRHPAICNTYIHSTANSYSSTTD